MTETSDLILSFRQRLMRAYAEIEEAQADAKEIELEAKASGLNVAELKKWVKAEHKDKVGKLVSDTVDRVLYGEALGHDLGMVSKSATPETSRVQNLSKEAVVFDPDTGEAIERVMVPPVSERQEPAAAEAPPAPPAAVAAPAPVQAANCDLDAGLAWAADRQAQRTVAAE